jgi:DNA-binding NarL/FixJ family response regulator
MTSTLGTASARSIAASTSHWVQRLRLATMPEPADRWDDPGVGSRVLVVDDDAGFRRAVRDLLVADGFDVVAEAGSAEEAVEVARLTNPEVVLLDVRLPGVDGITAAERLSRLSPRPDVVLVSTRAASTYGPRLRGAPVRGFVAKGDLSGAELRRLLAT